MAITQAEDGASHDERVLRRFYVQAEALVRRPVVEVWAERDSSAHSAWGTGSWACTPLAGPSGCNVGAGFVSIIPATGPSGLRTVWVTRVTAVVPKYSVTTETITPTLEHVETIRFTDVDGVNTRLSLEGWFTLVSTGAQVAKAQPHFQRLAQEYVDRVAAWVPEAP